MTVILNQTATEVENTPAAAEALDAIAHQIQRAQQPAGQWVILTWTQFLATEVIAIECLPDDSESETWVADAVMEATNAPVRQFIVAVNMGPGITLGWAFEPTGLITECALLFDKHVEAIQLNGPDLCSQFIASAKAFWGKAWEPMGGEA